MHDAVKASAPARANLLGEHTDYNNGYVLPMPLAYRTEVAMTPAATGRFHARSTKFDAGTDFAIGAPRTGTWTDYVAGCFNLLAEEGRTPPGVDILVSSDIPMGMGISSSAALTVATLRALRELLGLDADDVAIAAMAHKVEKEYVGVPCGTMDQMVSSVGVPGRALFFDTLTMKTELIDLFPGYSFCIVHSGVRHELKAGDGGYRQRVRECAEACRLLGLGSLRDLTPDQMPAVERLPSPIRERALHIYTENQRVLDGVASLRGNDPAAFGRLMVGSHESQRDFFEVSVPKIDRIVASSLRHGAIGARLTGGGFGGSVLALVESDAIDAWWEKVAADVEGIKLL